MKNYNMLNDDLKEFKPRLLNHIFGVRNGGHVAYVYYLREPRGDWETRYSVGTFASGRPVGSGWFGNDLEDAKEHARSSVRGKAFRNLLRRM